MPYPITNVQRHVVLMKYFRFYAPAIKKKKKKTLCQSPRNENGERRVLPQPPQPLPICTFEDKIATLRRPNHKV